MESSRQGERVSEREMESSREGEKDSKRDGETRREIEKERSIYLDIIDIDI